MAGAWRTTIGSAVSATVSAGIGPFQNPVTARTSAVEGSADVTASAIGSVLSKSEFTVDATQLTTGNSFDDAQLRSILETDTYPTSRFVQGGTVQLPGIADLRAGSGVTLSGNLTLHGVTRAVKIAAKILLAGQTITVSGTIPFHLADYGIHGSGLVSVGDDGRMEFQLVLAR